MHSASPASSLPVPIGATINGVRIIDDSTRVPLLNTPGYAVMHRRGGMQLAERVSLNFALTDLTGRNYRVHGSGVDAPGFNLFVGLRDAF